MYDATNGVKIGLGELAFALAYGSISGLLLESGKPQDPQADCRVGLLRLLC